MMAATISRAILVGMSRCEAKYYRCVAMEALVGAAADKPVVCSSCSVVEGLAR